MEFTKGLHELGDGLFAYLQPSGSWGYSNAGLVTADRESLLVDTLFDLRLTREMLAAMRPVTGTRPIETLVNTHANGDHCYGNELVPDRATIYATVAAAEEMKAMPAARLHALSNLPDADIAYFGEHAFGDFDFSEVSGRAPDETFVERLTLAVGDRTVELLDLGPAHTHSDSIAFVPSARTVFTGDLVFAQGTPVMWAGPVGNWLSACDTICGLEVDVVVPGHGPVTDKDGVRDVRAYLAFVAAQATERHRAGMGPVEAAWDIDLGAYADWSDSERIVVTVDTLYRELDPAYAGGEPTTQFGLMGRYQRGLKP
ncbi:MAG: cyclase [Solirubrobacteraceae bacterium]|nr:cyclase [Solirubrobacteraceae bacterium]